MKDILIDFGLPALVLVICFTLILTGQNGEVKSVLAMAAGWIFRSGMRRASQMKI
jgi:hypothetical protein